jgi:replication factor A1
LAEAESIRSIFLLQVMPDDSPVYVLAVISQCDDPVTHPNKKGREVTKRVLHLADASKKSIEVTVFGDNAQDMRLSVGTAIAIKGARRACLLGGARSASGARGV